MERSMRGSRLGGFPARKLRSACSWILRFLTVLVFSSSFVFWISFQLMRSTECEWLQKLPILCAHGGDPSKAFPNTMEAYYYALELHVNCVEIDISRSSDGVLFAIHDRELQKITGNKTAKFGYLSKSEINELDARHQQPIKIKKQQVPKLEDALKLLSKSVGLVILDAKYGPPLYEKGLAEEIISVVEKTNCSNCVILSKSDSLLAKINKLKQEIAVGYVVQNDLSTGIRSKLFRMKEADFVSVYHSLIDEKLVRTLHRGNKKVYAWTVDDESSMHRLWHQNIEVIITGKPVVLQGMIEKLHTKCGKEEFELNYNMALTGTKTTLPRGEPIFLSHLSLDQSQSQSQSQKR